LNGELTIDSSGTEMAAMTAGNDGTRDIPVRRSLCRLFATNAPVDVPLQGFVGSSQ
jgi:hypothetical protein